MNNNQANNDGSYRNNTHHRNYDGRTISALESAESINGNQSTASLVGALTTTANNAASSINNPN